MVNSDLALFPPLFLSEGKAMELFRKLREKPRGWMSRIPLTLYMKWFLYVKLNMDVLSAFIFRSSFSDQRCSGDSQEVVRLVVQAVHFYERKLRDFYTHLRYVGC